MGLIRLLLLGAVIYVVYNLVRRLGSPKPQVNNQPAQYSDMVRCAECGMHLPRDHAVRSQDGHYYCSVEHRDSNHK